jgi:hypothetical protein
MNLEGFLEVAVWVLVVNKEYGTGSRGFSTAKWGYFAVWEVSKSPNRPCIQHFDAIRMEFGLSISQSLYE